jgi:hypothetical protein
LYSELSLKNDRAWSRNHAESMNSLAIRLSQHGSFQESLRVIRLCCGLVQVYFEEAPDIWRPMYATVLGTFSNRLADVEQYAESLAQAIRVVDLWRQQRLISGPTVRMQLNLADALHNLAMRQNQNGDLRSAQESSAEAEAIRREVEG